MLNMNFADNCVKSNYNYSIIFHGMMALIQTAVSWTPFIAHKLFVSMYAYVKSLSNGISHMQINTAFLKIRPFET